MIRRHSGSASEPSACVGSPSRIDAQHALGVALGDVADQRRRRCRPRFVAGGRSTGTSAPVVVEVVLDELPPAGRAASRRAGASSLTISAGCSSAAAAGGDDPLRALVERSQRLASADRRPRRRRRAPGRREEAQHALALAAVGLAQPRRWTSSISMPRPAVAGGQRARRARGSPPGGSVDHRPHVQQRSRFHCSRRLGCAVRLEAADALERLARACARARAARSTRPVASRTGVRSRTSASANSRSSLRVGARDAVEQVDVLGRRQPLERELRRAARGAGGGTSSGAGRGARSSSTSPSGAGRNVKASIADMPRPARRLGDGDHDAMHAGRAARRAASAARSSLGELVARRRRPSWRDVEVGDGEVAVGTGAAQRGERRASRPASSASVDERRGEVPPRPVVAIRAVSRTGAPSSVDLGEAARACARGSSGAPRPRAARAAAPAPRSRMRAASSGASGRGQATSARDALVAVRRARGRRRAPSRCALHLGVDRARAPRDERLVEVAEAHLAGEVGDDRVAALDRERPAGRAPRGSRRRRARPGRRPARAAGRGSPARPRAPVARALLGEEHPVARLLQRRRAVEARRRRSGRARARSCATKRARAAPRPRRPASAGRRAGAPAGCAAARLGVVLVVARPRAARGGRRSVPAAGARPGRSAGSHDEVGARRRAGRRRSRATVGGVDVVAEHEPFERGAGSRGSARAPAAGRGRSAGERDPLAGRPAGGRRRRAARAAAAAPARRPGRWRRPAPRARGRGTARSSDVSIFMLSTTATTSPASTSSPGATGIDDDDRRREVAHEAAVVARDPVRRRRRPRRAGRRPARDVSVRCARRASSSRRS